MRPLQPDIDLGPRCGLSELPDTTCDHCVTGAPNLGPDPTLKEGGDPDEYGDYLY